MKLLVAFVLSLLISAASADNYVKCNADCVCFPDATTFQGTLTAIFDYDGPVTQFDSTKFLLRTFITQASNNQLRLTLTAPGAGGTVLLAHREGKGIYGNLYSGTYWYDSASTSVVNLDPGKDGSVSPLRPTELFSNFDGIDPRGNWTLTVEDLDAGSATYLQRAVWTIAGDATCNPTTKECTYMPGGGFTTNAFTFRVNPSAFGALPKSADFDARVKIQHNFPSYDMRLLCEPTAWNRIFFDGYAYSPDYELLPNDLTSNFFSNVMFTTDAQYRDFEYPSTDPFPPSELKFYVPYDTRKRDWRDGDFLCYFRAGQDATIEEFTLIFKNTDDPCASNPCQNGGVCSATSATSYSCDCTGTGFVGTDCGSCVEFRRAYRKVTLFNTFPVALNYKPAEDVYVRISSDCASFDECTLIFTPSNYNQAQSITAYADVPSPYNATSGRGIALNCPIHAYVVSNDECNGNHAESLAVLLDPLGTADSEATAYSIGDPHILTFDGKYQHFYDTGDFFFVREFEGNFVIQTRQSKCGHASCNTAAVFKTGSASIYFTTNNGPQAQVYGNLYANGMTLSGSGNSFVATNTQGVKVEVNFIFFDAYIIDIYVTLTSDFLTKVSGLAGFYSGVAYDDLVKPDGTTATTHNEFQQSWRASTSENLFVNPDATFPNITSLFDVNPSTGSLNKACSFTPTDKGPFNKPDPPVLPDPDPVDPNYIPPDCYSNATLLAEAQAACDNYFNDPVAQCCINAGVNVTEYSESCVCDYVLTGSVDFIISNVDAFYSACKAITNACDPCPSACSMNGDCNAGVCNCTQPFQGDDCSENWGNPPEITSNEITTDLTCSDNIIIYGKYFYGAGLICRFNDGTTDTDVAATKISNFQLLCALPSYPVVLGGVSMTVMVVRSDNMMSNSSPFTALTHCCSSPCQNGATCTDNALTGFSCGCPGDYHGDTCEQDPCTPSPCLNSGVCSVSGTTYTCDCTPTGGFTGTNCETPPPTTTPPPCSFGIVDLDIETSRKTGSDSDSDVYIVFVGSVRKSEKYFIGNSFAVNGNNQVLGLNVCEDIGIFRAIELHVVGGNMWRMGRITVSGTWNGLFGKHVKVAEGNPRTFELPFHFTYQTKNATGAGCEHGIFTTLHDIYGKTESLALNETMVEGAWGEFDRYFVNLWELKKIRLGSYISEDWDFDYITITRRGRTWTFTNTLGYPINREYHLWNFWPVSVEGDLS